MTQKTNSRNASSNAVSSNANPEKDICVCGHDGSHHGTSGACRFGTTHGCTVFTPKEN